MYSLSVRLLSPSITILKSIHVVAHVTSLLLLIAQWNSVAGCTPAYLLPVDGHLECVQVQVITDRAAVTVHIQASGWTYAFFSLE